jgi:hypothetical protein
MTRAARTYSNNNTPTDSPSGDNALTEQTTEPQAEPSLYRASVDAFTATILRDHQQAQAE